MNELSHIALPSHCFLFDLVDAIEVRKESFAPADDAVHGKHIASLQLRMLSGNGKT
jgi:hypothetical protein